MKRKIILGLVVLILTLIVLNSYKQTITAPQDINCQVKRGKMEVLVYTSGQLEAEKSENILVPEQLKNRDLRIYEIKITDLIPEGSLVDSGAYVGTLDQSPVEEKISKTNEELVTLKEGYEDAQMDSTLSVSNASDVIEDVQSQVDEKIIILNESVYESPAIIKKTQMDLERSKRQLEQAKNALVMKTKQESANLKRKKLEIDQKNKTIQDLKDLLHALTIYAPKKGMLIYAKDNSGMKITVGSTVSPWMPVIATLPDMTKLISRTFVNEIDISKIHKQQQVTLHVDAFSEKILKGEIIDVANIGQPMPKSDAKVFEVIVRVFGTDPALKPGMTTSNIINTGEILDTLIAPQEAIFTNDSTSFVYLKNGTSVTKQSVEVGIDNENFVVITKGLKEGDLLLLNEPKNSKQ